jgi:Rha family phage regulatory protein
MNELTIISKSGGNYIDSRQVADYIGKRHHDLLRDIGRYKQYMGKTIESKIAFNEFFLESSYVDGIGRTLPCYLVSKRGAEVISNKLTGEKGTLFTFAYVRKFNAMEEARRAAEIKAMNKPRLSEFNSAVRNVLCGMTRSRATPDCVMSFLRGVYEPLGIKVAAGGAEGSYHSATQIARSIGIYSDASRPHAHAIAAIISKLDMPVAEHAVAVPYGLAGVSLRYDLRVEIAVCEWLIENLCPREIPHLWFEYHVRYHTPIAHDDEPDYTADELDDMCGKFGDCHECPGLHSCCGDAGEDGFDDNCEIRYACGEFSGRFGKY